MRVLVVDIGGTNVKILATGQKTPRKFPFGNKLTPKKMVSGVKTLAAAWKYDSVAIGYPGRVRAGRIESEPHNLGPGWVGFNFKSAFGRPVASSTMPRCGHSAATSAACCCFLVSERASALPW
jgi:polyphosphate glucokinase